MTKLSIREFVELVSRVLLPSPGMASLLSHYATMVQTMGVVMRLAIQYLAFSKKVE